jgi:hypothetical protein
LITSVDWYHNHPATATPHATTIRKPFTSPNFSKYQRFSRLTYNVDISINTATTKL